MWKHCRSPTTPTTAPSDAPLVHHHPNGQPTGPGSLARGLTQASWHGRSPQMATKGRGQDTRTVLGDERLCGVTEGLHEGLSDALLDAIHLAGELLADLGSHPGRMLPQAPMVPSFPASPLQIHHVISQYHQVTEKATAPVVPRLPANPLHFQRTTKVLTKKQQLQWSPPPSQPPAVSSCDCKVLPKYWNSDSSSGPCLPASPLQIAQLVSAVSPNGCPEAQVMMTICWVIIIMVQRVLGSPERSRSCLS